MIAKLPMGDPIPDPRSKEARALTRVSGVLTLDFEQWFKDVHKVRFVPYYAIVLLMFS